MRNIRPSLKNLDRQTLADLFLRVLSDLDEKQLKSGICNNEKKVFKAALFLQSLYKNFIMDYPFSSE